MKKLLFLLISCFFLFSPPLVLAETLSIKTTADTFANRAYPDKNYGTAGSVVISNHPIFRFGFLKFPFPDLPEGATIDKISLRIYVHEQHYSPDIKIAVGVSNSEWDETSLTYDDPPSRWANELAVETFTLASGWNERDITRLFEEEVHDKTILNRWKDGDDSGFEIIPWDMVDSDAVINDFAFSFRTKESPSPETAAELKIDYHLPPSPSPSPAGPSLAPSPEPTLEEEETTIEESVTLSNEEGEETLTSPEASASSEEEKGLAKKLTQLQKFIFILIMAFLFLGIIITVFLLLYLQRKKEQALKPTPVKKKKSKKTK